jgi:hypothetical protein
MHEHGMAENMTHGIVRQRAQIEWSACFAEQRCGEHKCDESEKQRLKFGRDWGAVAARPFVGASVSAWPPPAQVL